MGFLLLRNLRNNSFGGSIPEAIGTLGNLKILNLADNMLEGSIPESFSNLTSLYYLLVLTSSCFHVKQFPTGSCEIPVVNLIHQLRNVLGGVFHSVVPFP